MRKGKKGGATYPDYKLAEMKAYVEIKMPKCKARRVKLENDRVLMRQLLSNIERNRMKIRKELIEEKGDLQLSHSRRIAI